MTQDYKVALFASEAWCLEAQGVTEFDINYLAKYEFSYLNNHNMSYPEQIWPSAMSRIYVA